MSRLSRNLFLVPVLAALYLSSSCGGSGTEIVAAFSRILVANSGASNLLASADVVGTTWTSHGTAGAGAFQFMEPYNVVVDDLGRIYVTDPDNGRVSRMNDLTGAGWVEISTGSAVTGIALDSLGRIYYIDHNDVLTRVDDMAGTNPVTFGTTGAGVGNFDDPNGIFVDPSDRIYIADSGNDRIVRIDDMSGSNWTEYGTTGDTEGQFSSPSAILIDLAGRIVVSDSGNDRLVRIDNMTGAGWRTIGTSGAGTGQFDNPQQLALDPGTTNMYVADTANNRIVIVRGFTLSGWSSISVPTPIGAFMTPEGVALMP